MEQQQPRVGRAAAYPEYASVMTLMLIGTENNDKSTVNWINYAIK